MTEHAYYRQLAEAVGAGESEFIPRIFEELINEDEAKVLLRFDQTNHKITISRALYS